MSRYSICLYSPDRHILYDGKTPDAVGVGGGLTARVRLAHALASLGHEVLLVGNCPREELVDGVRYVPLDTAPRRKLSVDAAILNTTGDQLDLTAVQALDLSARRRIVWVQGEQEPRGLASIEMDRLCVPSNFIGDVARDTWEVSSERIVVIPNGICRAFYTHRFWQPPIARDSLALAYASHPSKGLQAAMDTLRLLRERDPRFTLHVYGGDRLWGQAERSFSDAAPGVVYHGLLGQRDLARSLQRHSFSLNLQARREPFGIVIPEAMAAGCVVVASPVGAYPELIIDRVTGFLVPGPHEAQETQARAADIIQALVKDPERVRQIRTAAYSVPLDWRVIARRWTDYLDAVGAG